MLSCCHAHTHAQYGRRGAAVQMPASRAAHQWCDGGQTGRWQALARSQEGKRSHVNKVAVIVNSVSELFRLPAFKGMESWWTPSKLCPCSWRTRIVGLQHAWPLVCKLWLLSSVIFQWRRLRQEGGRLDCKLKLLQVVVWQHLLPGMKTSWV